MNFSSFAAPHIWNRASSSAASSRAAPSTASSAPIGSRLSSFRVVRSSPSFLSPFCSFRHALSSSGEDRFPLHSGRKSIDIVGRNGAPAKRATSTALPSGSCLDTAT